MDGKNQSRLQNQKKIFLCIFLIISFVFLKGCGNSDGGDTMETEADSKAPDAQFTASTDQGSAPLSVTFDGSPSTDDGTIATYAWDFGDGETGDAATITHTYTDAGTYTAQLTVTDDEGLSDSSSQDISVEDPTSQTYSISGTVTSATYAVVDSDVNDTNTTPVANDSFDDAQSVTAPITISGYVNVAGAGEDGNSKTAGDTDDYFLVTLTEGATITLAMTENPSWADLNLYLYDADQTQVDASLTTGDTIDSLTAPSDGTYYVRVEAVADYFTRTASGYALSIGQTSLAAAKAPLTLSDAFVPGEVLVHFDDQATADTIARLAGEGGSVSSMGLSAPVQASGRQRLLRRADTIDKATLFSNLGISEALARSTAPGTMDSATQAKMETLWMVRALAKQSGVKFAEPNYIRQAFSVPDDTYYTYQWHYPLINLPDAWDITTGSNDVVVAVVDTGVLVDHPDLSGQLLDGYDFISDTDISLDGDGVDDNPDDPGDQDDVDGSSFHGTHVAGTIAAASNNATGVAGVAWNTRILPLRVLGYGGGTSYDIIQAVRYAAGLSTDYSGVQRDAPVDVINLSLGGSTYSQSEAAVYQEVREQGVIVVAAAGNNATTDAMYPAAYDGVISVSAATIDEDLASYSSYGENVDVAAPGGASSDTNGDGYVDGILSTIGDDSSDSIEMSYAFSMGTSMAAPHVAGVVALMKALYPGLTPDTFDALLQSEYLTRDLGDADWDEKFGWGLIDAYKAVCIAQQGGENGGIPAILSVSPSTISLASTLSSAEVTLENSGNADATLTISAYTADVDWLDVVPMDTDANGLGTYGITVDRDGLADGTYTGTLTFTSSANQAQVAVTMQVGSDEAASDGGYHYILLLDTQTYETVAQVDNAGENGVYTYTFTGLAYGDTYAIYAGTNPDGDRYICEDGEACGSYLSLDQPATVTINADIENVDFITDINLNLSTDSQSFTPALPLYLEME